MSLSVTSNTVTVIRTIDNSVVSRSYVDRNPHEAFFAPDNRTIWVGTRGVDSVQLVDALNGTPLSRIPSYGGPSKVLFSPDGSRAYVNHLRSASIHIIDVASKQTIANITGLAHPFSSDMMLSADGSRLWVAHKMTGQVSILSTTTNRIITTLATGPETNHPNFAEINGTTYAFVTVASSNSTKVYTQPNPEEPPLYHSTIPSSGVQPHGLWPSPDNTRLYVLNGHSDTVDVVSLLHHPFTIIRTLPVGQEGQALIYVADAVPSGPGTQNLGTQGLKARGPDNILVHVANPGSNDKAKAKSKATALVNVREAAGLDMVTIIGRDLRLNATYTLQGTLSTANFNVSVPLIDFRATGMTASGCGSAPQVLGFFKFRGVYEMGGLRLIESQ